MSDEDQSESSAFVSRGQNSNMKRSTAMFQEDNPFLNVFYSEVTQIRFPLQMDEDLLSQ